MRKRFGIIFIFSTILLGQVQLSVPAHVFQISVRQSFRAGEWLGPDGQAGMNKQSFQIANYGKRYFDHEFLVNGYPANPYDLFDLDTLFATSSFMVGDIMRTFNTITAPLYGLDTLPDYATDFFQAPVTVGGTFDLKRTDNSNITTIRVIYGSSDRTNWIFELPLIRKTIHQKASWSGLPIAGLPEWLAYHQAAKSGMETIFNNSDLVNNGDGIWPLLQAVYDKFYTWDSPHSVLWALEGGEDPIKNGIYGTEYQPFTGSDTSRVTITDIFQYYFPSRITARGFGDLSLAFQFLAAGSPVWEHPATGYELYTGIRITLPLARTLSAYQYDSVFPQPVSQQLEFSLGAGVTQIHPYTLLNLRLKVGGRRLELSHRLSAGFSTKESLNTPLIFFPTELWHPDSLIKQTGNRYYYRRGYDIRSCLRAVYDLKPDLLKAQANWNLYGKSRDRYWSAFPDWDRYMQQHSGYDSRSIQSDLALALVVYNHNPRHPFWPLLFELEFGMQTSIFIRNEMTIRGGWLTVTTYFQSW